MRNSSSTRWLNSTVLGIGLTSLLSDWSHEIATAVLPALLVSLGLGPGWLGAIEGVADGLSSITKLISGHWTDRLKRRKPFVVTAYAVTALATSSIGFAANAFEILTARSVAWLARGVRSPARKAVLASSVAPETYGRAFGFERMMDTLGAIAAPITALWLLRVTSNNYRSVLLWSLLPGLAAAASFAFLVREKVSERKPAKSFTAGLRALPANFRWLLFASGIFGLGDFSHTMLILYAAQKLTPGYGRAVATSIAIGLYLLHNIFYASFAYVGGWLSDHIAHRKIVLAAAYGLAVVMAALLATGSSNRLLLALAFAIAGVFVGIAEALEDSLTAAVVPENQRGMAYGTLAAVNAVGDFASSVVIGAVWTAVTPSVAFAAAGILFGIAVLLILRLREGGIPTRTLSELAA